jgi:3-hydroxybutyryl-CoA dehydratase
MSQREAGMTPLLETFASVALMPVLMYQTALTRTVQYCSEQAEALAQLWASVAGPPLLAQGAAAPRQVQDSDLFLGKSLSKSKTITDLDTVLFGMLSLDFNPLHFNEELARRTRFAGRIVHGFHTASLFTGVLSELTPWCVFLHQEMDFTAPVRPGELITATGTIEEIDPKGVVQVGLVCRDQQGHVVVRGRAMVKKLKEAYQAAPESPGAPPVAPAPPGVV